MKNREWRDLIAKEFNVSNTVAKGMLHAMYTAKKYLTISRDVHKQEKEKAERLEKRIREWEECDRDDWNFFDSYNELLSLNATNKM